MQLGCSAHWMVVLLWLLAAAAAVAAATATAAATTTAADPVQRRFDFRLPVQLLHSVQRPKGPKCFLISQARIVVLLYQPPQLLSCMLQGGVLPRSDARHTVPPAGGSRCCALAAPAAKPAAKPAPAASTAAIAAAAAAVTAAFAAAAAGWVCCAAACFKGRPELSVQLEPQSSQLAAHLRQKEKRANKRLNADPDIFLAIKPSLINGWKIGGYRVGQTEYGAPCTPAFIPALHFLHATTAPGTSPPTSGHLIPELQRLRLSQTHNLLPPHCPLLHTATGCKMLPPKR